MTWFNIFANSKVDDEILDLYENIEVLIAECDEAIQEYQKYVVSTEYYKKNDTNKEHYSIEKVKKILNRIKEEYGLCYSMKRHKNNYDFGKTPDRLEEKQEIIKYLNDITLLLTKIYQEVTLLDKSNIKQNDLTKLSKNIDELIVTEKLFEMLKSKDEEIVLNVLTKIITESEENEKNGVWIISSRNRDKVLRLHFSQSLSLAEIRYLELIPIIQIKNLEEKSLIIKKIDKRSLITNSLHKDKVLPMLHYNVFINNKNIHVIPKNYAEKIKPYLILDESPLAKEELIENTNIDI